MNRNDSYQCADNVPIDPGFDDAGELTAKSALVLKLNALLVSQRPRLPHSRTWPGRSSPPSSASGSATFRSIC